MVIKADDAEHWYQPTVLLIAEPGLATQIGAEAVELARARLVGPVSFAEAPKALPDLAPVDGVLIKARGIERELLGEALDAAAAWLGTNDAHMVITLDDTQIDDVTSRLLGGRVQLLCAPTTAERVTALVLALAHPGGSGGGWVHQGDDLSDSDAKRLNELNAEVARIAETLARLARDQVVGLPAAVGDKTTPYRNVDGSPDDENVAAITATEIRQAIRARRLRDQYFGGGLFEDPAWDMLLDLSAAELERARVSVSSLCIAASVAPTTALRWISRMTEAGLFEREADPFDRRRVYMRLSEKGRDGMREYWRAVKRAKLLFA